MTKKSLKHIYSFWLDWKFRAKIISAILNVTLWSIAFLLVANYLTNVNQTMQQLGSNYLMLGDQALMRAAESVAEKVRVLETLARTPSIVEAAKEANTARSNWTPGLMAAKDEAWKAEDPGIEATVREIASNDLSAYLIAFQQANPEQAEVFITDGSGLNIAMTERTSDFLQADEDWWKSAFAGGYGSTYYGQVEYDESSKTYAMLIGVPIKDPKTQEVIGVLRGTLDTSIIINALGDLQVGTTGDVILIDSQGTVLYSRTPGYFLKPAPDAVLELFESEKEGWTQGPGMNGTPAIIAYSSLQGNLGKSLGWRLLITQGQAEAMAGTVRSLLISALAALLVAIIGTIVSEIVLSRSIAAPLTLLTQMAQDLSTGNITLESGNAAQEDLRQRKDEIGAISRAFKQLNIYFQGAAEASTSIANNDLRIEVKANSDRDALGIAFAKMVSGLRYTIGQVTQSAGALSSAASQLASASEASGHATSQIALTMKQVASGATQQSEEVSKTSGSVAQMSRAFDQIARGAKEQALAITRASTATVQISNAIQHATLNAQAGARGATQAADTARRGAEIVKSTIASIEAIKAKVDSSAGKVREMGQHSEHIDSIIETIDEIASQTNLLALNAAIEAAHLEARRKLVLENTLQQHMLGAASLVADFLAAGHALQSEDLAKFAQHARVEEFYVSDADGVIVAASNPKSTGFRFSEDPQHQSSAFRPLLHQQDGVVLQPIMPRDQDGKSYVYVGISRRDCPGVVQAGISGDAVERLGNYSHGFAVIADEIRKLSEHARSATKEIALIIRSIQKTALEAGLVMEDGAHVVEAGSLQAHDAGQALSAILIAAEAVNRQVEEIASAVQQMGASSHELTSVMNTVNAVVEANTAATEEMAASTSKLTQAIENIASISEENSAASEEVSASADELSGQVAGVANAAEMLLKLAADLQTLTNLFKL